MPLTLYSNGPNSATICAANATCRMKKKASDRIQRKLFLAPISQLVYLIAAFGVFFREFHLNQGHWRINVSRSYL